MSSKDAIARGYANLNDDLRYHLVEKAWFDQKQPDDAMRRDVDSTIAQYSQVSNNSAWSTLPDAEQQSAPKDRDDVDPSDLYGDGPESGPEHDEMGEFYGHEQGEVDASDLYGDGPGPSPERDGPEQDIELDRD